MSRKNDSLTVAAIAVVVYALCSVLHEGLGHGGACLLVGGRPEVLSSMHFHCDTRGLPDGAPRLIAAGGTLVNLIAAAAALAVLRRLRDGGPRLCYAVWLFAVVNLLLGTGYFLFSGVAGVGDWAAVVNGWRPAWLWRVALTLIGGLAYWLSLRLALRRLSPFWVGSKRAERVARARSLMQIPYFTGALLYCLAGALNPAGIGLVLLSAAPAALGGACGLAWGAELLWGDSRPPGAERPQVIERSRGWWIAAGGVALLFIGILGRSVRF